MSADKSPDLRIIPIGSENSDSPSIQPKKRLLRWILVSTVGLLAVILAFLSINLPVLSLLTFRQVDDYPLYTMQYRGDYKVLPSLGLNSIPGLASSKDQPTLDFACTVFYGRDEKGEALLGRNFDWQHKSSLLLFTNPPDGYASASMVDLGYLGFEPGGVSLLSLNNLKAAPLWPFDGMNERGLAIGMMAVPATPGLHDPAKPTIDSLSVIRLVLDYASDLDEALKIIQGVNIDFGSGPWLHYLLSDREGSAVVEILADRINVIHNQQPYQSATNFMLSGLSEPEADASCWRYQTASDYLEQNQGILDSAEAMGLLKNVSQVNTVWSVVYQLDTGEIQIAMGRDYTDVHNFSLAVPLKEIK